MKGLRYWVVGLMVLVIGAGITSARDNSIIMRGRLISVSPDDSSDTIADTGTGVGVDSAIVPEFDITFMLSDNWGIEVIAATSKHDLDTKGGAIGGLDAGSVWVLPPTVTLQYHFDTNTSFHPYVGLGLNFTYFYSYDLSSDLREAGVSDIDFDNSFGLAADLGFDVDISGGPWLFNVDVKYIDMSTDAEFKLAGGGSLDTVDVDIDPWVFGLGIGYRF